MNIKIGKLVQTNKICKCGKKALYFIYVEGKRYSVHYKCDDCSTLIKQIIKEVEQSTTN